MTLIEIFKLDIEDNMIASVFERKIRLPKKELMWNRGENVFPMQVLFYLILIKYPFLTFLR